MIKMLFSANFFRKPAGYLRLKPPTVMRVFWAWDMTASAMGQEYPAVVGQRLTGRRQL
jgi:hypothetical protein